MNNSPERRPQNTGSQKKAPVPQAAAVNSQNRRTSGPGKNSTRARQAIQASQVSQVRSAKNEDGDDHNKYAAVYIARISLFIIMFAFLLAISTATLYLQLNVFGHSRSDVSSTNVTSSSVSGSLSPCGQISIADSYKTGEEEEYVYTFAADLSEYEEYMEPDDRDGYLKLINYANTLDENYIPDDLVKIPTRSGRDVQYMRKIPAAALTAMLTEAAAEGIDDISVTSGYRSYNTQTWLLQQQVAKYASSMSDEEAYALAITEVAIPGTSEHQGGMCVDVHNLPSADISFAETEAGKWLAANCYKFGFILRYPEDKTDITKISFEPWHFRFVGRYHASRMHELGMCLEEYTDFLNGE